MAIGQRNGVNQEYYEAITASEGIERVSQEAVEQCFTSVIEKLDALLDAPISPSGEMDIVIAAESGGVIIHEAVGHGLEGDVQASSTYAGKIGTLVANPKVTVIDDPTLPGLRGSYTLDHEGNPAERSVLIEKGVLKNYLHQESSAKFLGLPKN